MRQRRRESKQELSPQTLDGYFILSLCLETLFTYCEQKSEKRELGLYELKYSLFAATEMHKEQTNSVSLTIYQQGALSYVLSLSPSLSIPQPVFSALDIREYIKVAPFETN